VNAYLERLQAMWRDLAPREQILVGAAGGIVVLAILVIAIIQPVVSAADRASERRLAAEQQLQAITRLAAEYDQLGARLEKVEERIRANREKSNLRSLLESLASQSQVRISSMEERQSGRNENYAETKLEVNLKSVTLSQTVRYLHNIESSNRQLSIKSLRIKSQQGEDARLDVTFSVSSFEPT
jgi:type II secretory pathway component PulM